MLHLNLRFLICFALIQSGVFALVLSTTTGPIPITTVPMSFANFVSPSDASPACIYLANCRTLLSIVQSCLLTIFACVWVAVHRNIPGPRQKWIVVYLECVKVVILTLLVPEWILAWAVRQYLRARKLAKELEAARCDAKHNWEKKHKKPAAKTTGSTNSRASGDRERVANEIECIERSRKEAVCLIELQPASISIGTSGVAGEEVPDTCESIFDQVPGFWLMLSLGTAEKNLGRTNARELNLCLSTESRSQRNVAWTVTHAFFVIMGGFHYYSDGEPLHPLHPFDVVNLVQHGALVPPTSNELNDKSKSDALSKGVAIIQTLWFVTQCIARRIEHLPITNLELMTLAYTVIIVAMYAAWWHKPLNIGCPVRIPGTAELISRRRQSFWPQFFKFAIGDQDNGVVLSEEDSVPTFWAGGSDIGHDVYIADVIALTVAMAFGAVHCTAWSYTFPSPIEQLMWRVSAISIVAVPVIMGLSLLAFVYLYKVVTVFVLVAVSAPCAIIYIAARLVLLFLSFTILRSLPFAAYQTVEWTTFIPHI